jgi:hypothetical protein
MENKNPFIGTWKLISWENTNADGTVTYPYGKNPVGYILYTEDGYMAAEIMNPNRRQSDPDFPLEPAFAQTLNNNDRLMAYETYLSYCGSYSYSLEERTITHHVKTGLIPSWSGKDQFRQFEFKDGKLILGNLRAQLIWESAASHA